jgi:UDP-N-acetylmuramate dehydrogenase
VDKVRKFVEKINIAGSVRADEPLSLHTSFRVGGPADVYVEPLSVDEMILSIRLAQELELPWIVLGAGSNVLVADEGIEGVVISTVHLNKIETEGTVLYAEAGATVERVTETACKAGLGGVEFLSSMPGSIGGAVWMNARCYGAEVADVLIEVGYLNTELALEILTLPDKKMSFGYKVSPFQKNPWIILYARFQLHSENPANIEQKMIEYQEDRTRKGHFIAPSAGSIFKNDRSFGAPAGVLLDRLGFKSFRIGDAEVSPLHANIILNRGKAQAKDIRQIITRMEQAVLETYGRALEPEVLFIGRWESRTEKNNETRR